MEKEILEKKDDKDFANSTFAKLSVRVKKTTKKSVKLVWKKMSEQQSMLYMELNVAHRIRRLKK